MQARFVFDYETSRCSTLNIIMKYDIIVRFHELLPYRGGKVCVLP